MRETIRTQSELHRKELQRGGLIQSFHRSRISVEPAHKFPDDDIPWNEVPELASALLAKEVAIGGASSGEVKVSPATKMRSRCGNAKSKRDSR